MIRPSSYIALPLAVAVVEQWSDVQPDRLTVALAEASLLGRVMPFAARDRTRCGRTFGKPKKLLNGTWSGPLPPKPL